MEIRRNDFYKKKHILITGGLGFIGSNLSRKLIALGSDVTVIDSLIPEYGGNIYNVHGFEEKLHVNISDVRDAYSLNSLVQGKDILFNLAGQTSHMDSMKNPFNDLDINGKAQLHILEACRKYNPDIKIVFASTRQVYGRAQYLPADENHPLSPVDINGVNKLSGEWFHLLYHQVYGIPTAVLRLTNTIGPCMRIKDQRQTFLGIWIRNLLEEKPFEVWGGEQLRDFTYIEDALNAFLLIAENEDAFGEIFNLGGKRIISLKDLAELLVRANKGMGEYIIKEYPDDRKKIDIGDYYSDFSKIKKAFMWEPTVQLEDGLRETMNYYRKHLKHYI